MSAAVMNDLMLAISDDDVPFEEDLLRNPYTLRVWTRYISTKHDASFEFICFLYERALAEMPGSYKLWKKYLDLRRSHIEKDREATAQDYQAVNFCYERAVRHCSKMPRLWLDCCQFLTGQGLVSRTRRTFDKALQCLPVTQHYRIWEIYLKFAKNCGVLETSLRIYRRYLKIEPDRLDEFIEFLIEQGHWDEAAKWMVKSINREKFYSSKGKTIFQVWGDLSDLICEHSGDIKSLPVESIIRAGIYRFHDQVGRLWNSLARYFILKGQLEKARDIFEEAIVTVSSIRDFTQIFDAYIEFEESVISSKMEAGDADDDLDIDLRLARLENLMDRRPLLVNDVLLRQNPHSVLEWAQRVELFSSDPEKVVDTYSQALATIVPKKAHGRLQSLWIDFAKFYEDLAVKKNPSHPDLTASRKIFEKSLTVPFKHPDNLAECYVSYAEMELRHEHLDLAIQVLGKGTAPPNIKKSVKSIKYLDESLSVQYRVFKSIKLWTFYVDLEEAIGNVESTRAVYDRMMELKIVTPQVIINYAVFLEENKFFEESFKIYERGIEIFGYPIAFDIWNIYLQKFMARYGGTKLERARDLFEQALDKCPEKFCKAIYLLYGKLEEDYGLAKRGMQVYDRATAAVPISERYDMFLIYIAKAVSFFGMTSARPIYTKAVESLPEAQAKEMATQFIEMELKLGEVDRARGIYTYVSQFADPKSDLEYYERWHDFEVRHGNEDTFKEMLRIKRSVQASFSNTAEHLAAQLLATKGGEGVTSSFVSAGAIMNGKAVEPVPQVEMEDTPIANPDEIAIDYMDEEVEAEHEQDVTMEPVPTEIPKQLLAGSGLDKFVRD